MYCCTDCKREFDFAEVVFETHGLSSPPYERIKRCPFCHSNSFEEIKNTHCCYCGSKLRNEGLYCSERCKVAGERCFAAERERRKAFEASPVALAIKEVSEYNRVNGTKYSYGQYFALKGENKL